MMLELNLVVPESGSDCVPLLVHVVLKEGREKRQ